jgi:hypothetical protein
MQLDDHEKYRRDVLKRACQQRDLRILFSDFLFINYETLEEDVQMNDGFQSLEDAKLAFVLYQQAFFNYEDFGQILDRAAVDKECL